MVVLSLLNRENKKTLGLFVDYGQAALVEESAAAQQVANYFGTSLVRLRIELPISYRAGEIRHRNGALIFAAAMATAETTDCIAVGVHAGVPYPDCSEAFLVAIEAALRASNPTEFRVIAPLRTWRKPAIIAYAKQEGLPIGLTYSCEVGGIPPCGQCASCLDRVGL